MKPSFFYHLRFVKLGAFNLEPRHFKDFSKITWQTATFLAAAQEYSEPSLGFDTTRQSLKLTADATLAAKCSHLSQIC